MELLCPRCSAKYFVDDQRYKEKGFRCNVCQHLFAPQAVKEAAPQSPEAKVRAAFDPSVFRAQGHRMVDLLADYLGKATQNQGMPVVLWMPPEKLQTLWPAEFPHPNGERGVGEITSELLSQSMHLHHPRFMGHQVSIPLPMSALFDLAVSILNNGMAIYEMGPAMTVIERNMIRWMAGQIGFPSGADGVFTSGGSLGNLTVLLAMRQAKAGHDAWNQGEEQKLAILGADQAHYSIQRAVQIMGWGKEGFWMVPVDEQFRLKPKELKAAKRAAEAAGRKVIGVVGSACSTALGAFDPLEEIADFCKEHNLWFHVDAAHGASALLSKKYRGLLKGAERADSLIWDAHKMMLMPSLCTAVIFREEGRSYEAFAQKASYLFTDRNPKEEWFNMATRTLECTKRAMGVKLYAALSVYGPDFFGQYVDMMFDLAKVFGEKLKAAKDFELAVEPECNIVCFRYKPPFPASVDLTQYKVRQRLLSEGSFYIVQTQLPKGLFLRVTLLNPFTTEADLEALMASIRSLS